MKVCLISGSRAEFGYLIELAKALQTHPKFKLQLLLTGSHLSKLHGYTLDAWKEEGLNPDATIDLHIKEDTPLAASRYFGAAAQGCGEALSKLNPDFVVVLGDRYELLASVTSAVILGIPIIHLGGGDLTEGAFDDGFRHAITKLSHLHFVSNEQAKNRVLQLGEDPQTVFNVGSTTLDYLLKIKLLSLAELEKSLEVSKLKNYYVVALHPETLGNKSTSELIQEVLTSLNSLDPEVGLLLTGSNLDPEGQKISQSFKDFSKKRAHTYYFESLGQLRFLSAIQHSLGLIGNSSSGIYEVPALKRPTINIGDRQKGRLRAQSVLDVPVLHSAILSAIQASQTLNCQNIKNPYGEGNSVPQILKTLETVSQPKSLLKKKFFNLLNSKTNPLGGS